MDSQRFVANRTFIPKDLYPNVSYQYLDSQYRVEIITSRAIIDSDYVFESFVSVRHDFSCYYMIIQGINMKLMTMHDSESKFNDFSSFRNSSEILHDEPGTQKVLCNNK